MADVTICQMLSYRTGAQKDSKVSINGWRPARVFSIEGWLEVCRAPMISEKGRDLCPRLVLAVFGGLFLIALLSVPVTTTESRLRQDPASRLVFRTTYPKYSRMFLPSYLAARARAGKGEIRVRSAQWAGTMAVVAVLGLFDSFALCRILRVKKTRAFFE